MTELALSTSQDVGSATRSVLIVDDEPAIRTLLREIAEGLSVACRVYEAADGQLALQIARATRIDLVLLDIVLPGSSTSGVLVCQELCKDTRTKVVIVSGNAGQSILSTCLSMGAADCVRKPFSADQLRDKLTAWLAD
jgi:CheY-like chemotaxis protein